MTVKRGQCAYELKDGDVGIAGVVTAVNAADNFCIIKTYTGDYHKIDLDDVRLPDRTVKA